jgi:ribosomal protein S18 acetylase RimI-like enzyme
MNLPEPSDRAAGERRKPSGVAIRRLRSAGEIVGALEAFDRAFPRSLRSRVGNLDLHAEKLSGRGFVYSAEADGLLAGFAAFYANDLDSFTAYLTHIAVADAFQGMGIGRMLMRTCMDVSKGAGMRKVKLEVDTANAAAIGLYESLGFLRYGPASPESCFMLLDSL